MSVEFLSIKINKVEYIFIAEESMCSRIAPINMRLGQYHTTLNLKLCVGNLLLQNPGSNASNGSGNCFFDTLIPSMTFRSAVLYVKLEAICLV